MKVKDIVIIALFASMTFVTTAFVKVPIAYGYIHAGDIFIFTSCFFLKPKYAAVSAGVGSMFADLTAGALYVIYMPVTLVVKAGMAFIAGMIMGRKTTLVRMLISFIPSALFMLAGYFVFEGFYYGWAAAVANIPLSLIQPAVGIAVAIPLILIFKRTPAINKYHY